ncbi:TetR/AcrR family transcriptional regulator [Devosia sp. LC5]|uniref:TetR/AcrR family transcriptional regulator n=1 Tax=Devosia sp. LC5 TaxID=1502724 RepID=UPI00054D4EC3|nr:TetR/AcrR family transcriptional regulator [Devosia sp. LC5]
MMDVKTKRTRLNRDQRRRQLLDVAKGMVGAHGADALTLVSLAETAGVSRPVVYDQFQTRSGLFIALYEEIAERQFGMLRDRLANAEPAFRSVAEAASEAYMRCYATVGPEAFAIVAALKGDEAMERFGSELLRRYIDAYAEAFRPYTRLPEEVLTVRCTAIVGAAEALSGVMVRSEIEEPEAVATLFSLIISWFSTDIPSDG